MSWPWQLASHPAGRTTTFRTDVGTHTASRTLGTETNKNWIEATRYLNMSFLSEQTQGAMGNAAASATMEMPDPNL